jgi:hypothetical protein
MIFTDAEKKWIAEAAGNTLERHYREDPLETPDDPRELSIYIDLGPQEINFCKSLREVNICRRIIRKCEVL